MKILVVFYSRTGTTRKVAEMLREKLNAEIEEIKDTVDRMGVRGYLISGRDAMKRRLTKLEPVKNNPAKYDLVLVGTPIWGWNISVPVRTYLMEQKDNFKGKVAFFCTMGGSGDNQAFLEMEKIVNKKPADVLALKTQEVWKKNISGKIERYIEKLQRFFK